MRLVFIGSTKFGLRCLKKTLGIAESEVVGVVTAPARFLISHSPQGVTNVLHADFRPVAEAHGTPVWVMEGKMADEALVARIREWAPDFILVVGWYHLVPRVIREVAPTGGLHASLLPDYSGGAPLVWAIINGEERTGITFFLFDGGVDTGPIIGQAEEPIYLSDTIATLYARIEDAGLRLLEEHLPRIARGQATFSPQDESRRRIMPQRSPADGEVDWGWPARRIYDFIRAQTKPYPGAFTFYMGQKITIWVAKLHDAPPHASGEQAPGTVIASFDDSSEFRVVCGDGKELILADVEMGGVLMNGSMFRSRRLGV